MGTVSNNLEVIDGFKSPGELNRFERWLQREVDAGCAVEVDVKNYYAGENFKERWFYFKEIDSVWRLVCPDGPFHGYWGAV
ncbi:hypothetical protein [Aquitalea sp. ASV11]|uniref:hypothetical protein n=1 Tax=Aquitalea sp. ASV11 TaxID=2795103 RepID=UPI0018ED7246|nr:hypothetical protein [Aquitalea sp. ASV11]